MTSPAAPLILIIDEVEPVVRLIEMEMALEGFRTETAILSEDPVSTAIKIRPDGLLLGSMLPSPELYDVLQTLKERIGVPLLLMTTTASEADAAIGLELGADDVLSRPYTPGDLAFRMNRLLRREQQVPQNLERGSIRIDISNRLVWNEESRVDLGTTEWTLLLALMRSEEAVQSADLLTMGWGPEYAEDRDFLRIWINRLRAKLGDDSANPTVILDGPGEGYTLAR